MGGSGHTNSKEQRRSASGLALVCLVAAGMYGPSAHAGEAPAGPTRADLIAFFIQALADGKKPSFEIEMGRESVKAQVVAADADRATVSASGMTMPRAWEKLTDRHLFQMAMHLAGEDAAAQHRAVAFALDAGLDAEARRALDALLARNPHDHEAHRLQRLRESAVSIKSSTPPVPGPGPSAAKPTPPSVSPRVPLRANWYVAPQGDDQNPGTAERPFATLQRALEAAGPGQLIYLRGGLYRPSTLTQFKKVGRPDAYIEVHGFPGELPIIDGSGIDGELPTWRFAGARYLRIRGPLRLTNGRGAGLFVDHDSKNLEFHEIESSYNGKKAERGGHGFFVHGDGIADLTFKNCDAHHNANHAVKPGEDVEANIYQHGDGWRIFSGTRVRLDGCRAWHNLDDAYDLTQAKESIELRHCWAAYSGLDDAQGSITGKPGWGIRRYDGDGFKLGYKGDTGPHKAVRCLSWNNFSHGWNVAGGPYVLQHCVAYNNREDAFFGLANMAHEQRNGFAWKNRMHNNVWAKAPLPGAEAAMQFVSLSDEGMLGPRLPDGSLPATDFLRPAAGSALIDGGVDLGEAFGGRAPDIGYHEAP